MIPHNAAAFAALGVSGTWSVRGTMERAMEGTYHGPDLFLTVTGEPRDWMWFGSGEAI